MAKKDKQALAAKKKRRQKEKQQALQKKENTKKVLKISLIVFIAVCVLVAIVFIVITIIDNSGAKIRSQTFLKTEHYNIDGAMMSCFIYDSYNSFKEYYGTYLSSLIDTSKDLKEQSCTYATEDMGTGERTWFDYFVSDAESSATSILRACELAHSMNISLTDEELDAINIRAKQTDLSAIGNGVTTKDVANCLKLKVLAYKCVSEISEDINISDEEIEKYYLDDKDEFDQIEYLSVSYTYTSENKAKIDARVDALTNAADKDEFVELLKKYYTSDGTTDVEKAIYDCTFKVTKTNNELADDEVEWLFSAQVNDIKSFTTESKDETTGGSVTIYLVASEPCPNNSHTKSVRHILFDSNEYGSLEEAERLAKNVVEKLKANNTLEYFKELVCAYSSDSGSVSNGGLYSNVKENALVASFNDWAFDENRQPGDIDLISSTYGYHIVYFEGEGLPAYKGDIYSALFDEKFNLRTDSLMKDISVDRNSGVLKDIKGKF